MTEPIPDDCLPPENVIRDLLRGPRIDPETGRIVGGTYHGMTPAEVLADRAAFNRSLGIE
jgi:hypothetical protein